LSTGGRQGDAGVFASGTIALPRSVSLSVGLRYDRWDNVSASTTSAGVTTELPDRSATAYSPRVTLLAQLTGPLSFTASAYGSFRAPTLNELSRGFRVGNTVTQANPGLDAERLRGAESGLLYTAADGRVAVRGTLFWMEVSDPIANVTIA